MFDLATAKTRLNIVGAVQDAEIQAALDASLAIAEAYCKRRFKYSSETESVYHDSKGYLFLERYPIDHVTTITAEDHNAVKYKINKTAGYLDLHGRYSFEQVDVVYTGGYKVLPDDLIVALWAIFDGVWKSQTGGDGTVGAIESVSLTGVGTVRMGSGNSGIAGVSSGAIPDLATAILSNYKRWLA